MESTDILASIVASTTAGDRRNRNFWFVRINSGVGAVLEYYTVAAFIVGVICLEGGSIKSFVQSGVANSASLLLLFARSSANRLITTTVILSSKAGTAFATPVVPPGLINVASRSFATNLEIAAICDNYWFGGRDIS